MKIINSRVDNIGIKFDLDSVSFSTSVNGYISPFANCQTFSLAGIGTVLEYGSTDEILDFVKHVSKEFEKEQFVIDIHNKPNYIKKVESLFDVVGKIKYTNLTESEMIIYLLRIK